MGQIQVGKRVETMDRISSCLTPENLILDEASSEIVELSIWQTFDTIQMLFSVYGLIS